MSTVVHSRDPLAARVRFPELLQLHRPGAAGHVVQFYDDDAVIVETVSYLTAKALKTGSSALIIATPSHRLAIEEHLTETGLDVGACRNGAPLTAKDAADTLSQFMVDGSPDRAAFDLRIGGMIGEAAGRSATGFVFAFGEMVALLCAADNLRGAVRLEQLWNRLGRRQNFSLYCAYPISCLNNMTQSVDALIEICAQHWLTIPA
jgi:MEDS: MEthanogen/methylotroph, DcmR Sensory domain